jgi:hypothetical protein
LHYEGQASWTDHAAVDCGMPLGGPSGREEESRTSEAIILVGSIPCPMPTPSQLDTEDGGIAVDEEKVAGLAPKIVAEGSRKMARLVINSGREVVGPGYSAWPTAYTTQRAKQWVLHSLGRATVNVGSEAKENVDDACMHRPTRDSAMQKQAGKAPAPRWCPPGLSKTQRRRL